MLPLLRRAADVAVNQGEEGRSFLLGAVAIRRDQAVVQSSNGIGYFPCKLAHAEARVLKKAGKNSIVYVARVSRKDGSLVLARPCESCQSMMIRSCVKKCYYTISDNEYGVMVFQNNNTFSERIKNTSRQQYAEAI